MGTVVIERVPESETDLVDFTPNGYFEEATVTFYWVPLYVREGIEHVIDFLKSKGKDESHINGYQIVNGVPVFLVGRYTDIVSDDLLGGESEEDFMEKHTIQFI